MRSSLRCPCVVLLLSIGCGPKSTESPQPQDEPRAGVSPSNGATSPAAEPAAKAEPAATAEPVAKAEPAATAEPAAKAALEFTFVGDVIFGRYRASGYDPIPEKGFAVFDEIAPKLASDVLVGNLETPLVRDLPLDSPIGSRYRFGASPEHAKHLQTAGFTAVSLANNHWFDQRVTGIDETPPILRELGIVPLGGAVREGPVFRVETVEKAGWKLGFVAITTRTNAPVRDGMPVLPYLPTDEIDTSVVPVVTAARADHDLVIVVVHWGEEYADAPNHAQIKAAHALVDAGADMVIGHHPHVLQAVERYGKGLIAYSMGNFLFENTNAIPRLTGVLRVKVRRDDRCLERVVFHPAYIKRSPVPHPVPATGSLGRQVRDRAMGQSKKFDTTWTIEGDDLVLDGGC
jgi:poly-gamma-glutamate capsule biosynthesis protein CapA/YwtB (metallophosphatase superfamily)